MKISDPWKNILTSKNIEALCSNLKPCGIDPAKSVICGVRYRLTDKYVSTTVFVGSDTTGEFTSRTPLFNFAS